MALFFKKSIAVTAILGVLVLGTPVQAISIPDTLTNTQNVLNQGIQTGERLTGVRLDTLLAAAGLSNEKFRDCLTPNLLGSIANTIKNFDDLLKNAVSDFINQMFTFLKAKLIFCSAGGIIKKFTGAGIDCTASVVDQASATLKNIKNREIQQNFIANCIARIGIKDMGDMMTNYLQQNGPYGSGPNWVESWESIPKTAERRAQGRFWTELVNTNICVYMREQVYAYFRVPQAYIDDPPPLTGISVDTGDPFPTRAACTLPAGFIPANFNDPNLALAVVEVLAKPQNNPSGFIAMAEAELANQKNAMVTAAQTEAISGGGILSPSECLTRAPDGSGLCLLAGPNKQAPAIITAQFQAIAQGEINSFQKDAVDDLRIQVANRLFDLANAPLPLRIELGPQYDVKNFQNLAPAPLPSAVPGDGSANDPVCTGGNPSCTCVKNDATTQAGIASVVAPAIASTLGDASIHTLLNGFKIPPGTNYRTVLQNICNKLNADGSQTCIPHPTQDDQIVLDTGALTVSVSVITPDGALRINGGQAILACEPGIQN